MLHVAHQIKDFLKTFWKATKEFAIKFNGKLVVIIAIEDYCEKVNDMCLNAERKNWPRIKKKTSKQLIKGDHLHGRRALPNNPRN